MLTLKVRAAVAQFQTGERREALQMLDEVIGTYRAAATPDVPGIFYVESMAAQLLTRSESWTEAEERCRRALALASHGGIVDYRLAQTLLVQGMSLRKLDRLVESEQALQRAYALFEQSAPRDRYVRTACLELLATYQAMNRGEERPFGRAEAEEWSEARAMESAGR